MIILSALIGLLLGTSIAFGFHKIMKGFCLPPNLQAATATGWLFAIFVMLWALYLRFAFSSEEIIILLLTAVIVSLLATIYTKDTAMTIGQSIGVALTKVGFLILAALFVSYLSVGDAVFWFTYGFSCVLTFLVLESFTPTP